MKAELSMQSRSINSSLIQEIDTEISLRTN